MKKKVTLTIVAIVMVLIISSVGTIVYADLIKKPESNGYLTQKEVAEPTKTVQTDSGENKTVDYVGTNDRGTVEVDVYEDNAGNKYSYDEKGAFYSYFNRSDVETDTPIELTPDTAPDLAMKYVRAHYGERADGFELVFCRATGSGENTSYQVVFSNLYGEGNFIQGTGVVVRLMHNGILKGITMGRSEFENFDGSLLEDISEETIKAAIREAHSATTVELSEVKLAMVDGEAVIQVSCKTDGKLDEYYYAF